VAPDEFITVDGLVEVGKVHLATALDVLHDDVAGALTGDPRGGTRCP
jgi:hypothetical protein